MIIKKINNLALDIQKTPNRYWLNIMQQSKDGTYYWVISGFDYDKEYELYQLNSIGDRLNDKEINWNDYGELVKLGYEILNSNNKLEKIYNDEIKIIEEDNKIEKIDVAWQNVFDEQAQQDFAKMTLEKINELIDAVNSMNRGE